MPLGPNGEHFIPEIFPHECLKFLDKMLLPPRWVGGIDATPDREHTLKNRKWWELNSPWLEANKKSIGLKAQHWKMRDEAYAKEEPLEEDKGNLPDDFICIHPPGAEQRDSEDEYDEDDDEDEDGDDDASDKGRANEPSAEMAAMHKIMDKFASLHPDHIWVSSMSGYERKRWWLMEILKRDQDDFSLHIYNDFTSYGAIEVLENLVVNPHSLSHYKF